MAKIVPQGPHRVTELGISVLVVHEDQIVNRVHRMKNNVVFCKNSGFEALLGI